MYISMKGRTYRCIKYTPIDIEEYYGLMVKCILSIRFCMKWEFTTVVGCGGRGVPCPNSVDRQPCKQNEVNSNIIKEEYGNTETFLIFMGFIRSPTRTYHSLSMTIISYPMFPDFGVVVPVLRQVGYPVPVSLFHLKNFDYLMLRGLLIDLFFPQESP